MQFSPQQSRALTEVDRWYNDTRSPQIYRLFGYAGTGKTTLAQHFANNCDGEVLFAAYTGKAAHVLQQKGARGASTIHRLIYRYIPDTAPPQFTLNYDESPLVDADLLIVDEVSMVDEELANDLLSFGVKILVLGDPFQLPPVKGTGYFTEAAPDLMLTEIHRQAEDNPIIKLATLTRQSRPLQIGKYGESEIIWGMPVHRVEEAGQLLVGKNATRGVSNTRARLLKFPELRDLPLLERSMPRKGDKIVCLRNNHQIGLLNGSIWYIDEVCEPVGDESPEYLYLNISSEDKDDSLYRVPAHIEHFRGDPIDPFLERRANSFDFGYALTCHKAQGSQWDHVLIADESRVFGQNRHRWLYTAITRAAEKVVIARSAR